MRPSSAMLGLLALAWPVAAGAFFGRGPVPIPAQEPMKARRFHRFAGSGCGRSGPGTRLPASAAQAPVRGPQQRAEAARRAPWSRA